MSHRETHRRPRGFTLIELIVVMGIIVLIAGIALPSITSLMESSADKQAYNILAGQLRAARALAIRKGTFAGVHIQPANASESENPDIDEFRDTFFSAVVEFKEIRDFRAGNKMKPAAVVDLAEGFEPIAMPEGIGFISLDMRKDAFFDKNTGEFNPDPWHWDERATAITILFSPEGRLVRSIYRNSVAIDPDGDLTTGSGALWETVRGLPTQKSYNSPNDCSNGVVLIEYRNYENISKHAMDSYLWQNAQFLPVNPHTGMLYPRE